MLKKIFICLKFLFYSARKLSHSLTDLNSFNKSDSNEDKKSSFLTVTDYDIKMPKSIINDETNKVIKINKKNVQKQKSINKKNKEILFKKNNTSLSYEVSDLLFKKIKKC